MKTYIRFALMILACAMAPGGAQANGEAPVVLELFTSQGCSSCPPADALLTQLAKEPGIVALSFHVDYWNRLGWNDPFSSPENTNRQRQYAQSLHLRSVFTPQLVVDGRYSVVGGNGNEVSNAIGRARQDTVRNVLSVDADEGKYVLNVHVDGRGASDPQAVIIAVHYQRHANTLVAAGENIGRRLASINNVTGWSQLGSWQAGGNEFKLPLPADANDGIAVMVQEKGQGQILGADYYPK